MIPGEFIHVLFGVHPLGALQNRGGIAQRAKQSKLVSATAGRLMKGVRVSGWKQAINQMAVAYPDSFDNYL